MWEQDRSSSTFLLLDIQILTEDYSKAAFLCSDRTVVLHARFGSYYKTRVPKYGRDLSFGEKHTERTAFIMPA